MKNLFKTNTNTLTKTNKTNLILKGEKTMKNTRTKKRSFKTRIIATALSAITLLSVGSIALTPAAAAEKESIGSKITSSVTDYFKDTSLGFVKNTAWKLIGPELTKVG